MLDSRRGPRLGAEALPVGIVLGDVWTDQLQRDDTVELDVASAEDDAHAAAGEFPPRSGSRRGVPAALVGQSSACLRDQKITGNLGCVFTIRLPNPSSSSSARRACACGIVSANGRPRRWRNRIDVWKTSVTPPLTWRSSPAPRCTPATAASSAASSMSSPTRATTSSRIILDTGRLPGGHRFVDEEQVERIHERGVVLTISGADAGAPRAVREPQRPGGRSRRAGARPLADDKLKRAWHHMKGQSCHPTPSRHAASPPSHPGGHPLPAPPSAPPGSGGPSRRCWRPPSARASPARMHSFCARVTAV